MRKTVFISWIACMAIGLISLLIFGLVGNWTVAIILLCCFGVGLPAALNAPYAAPAAWKALRGKSKCNGCCCAETEQAVEEKKEGEESAAEAEAAEPQECCKPNFFKKALRGICNFGEAFGLFFGGLLFAFVWIPVRMFLNKESYKSFCTY